MLESSASGAVCPCAQLLHGEQTMVQQLPEGPILCLLFLDSRLHNMGGHLLSCL